jgi:predicted MFS family arabinose efflux permease
MSEYNTLNADVAALDRGSGKAIVSYRGYVVAVIWVVMLLRFVDLQIISVLVEPIKKEFTLTDTQLGLLTGFAFSIFYGLLGLPVAWLADRSNRKNIIAGAVGLWSLMTALSGTASSFGSLLLARIGVGIGEAGGTAPAYSLIADYIPPRRRATVFAALNCAVPVGVFVGFLIGGYVGTRYGWRAAFMVVGLPGILIALLVWLTIKEPPRGFSERANAIAPVPLRSAVSYLLRTPSFRHFVLGSSIFTMGAMGSGVWITSFFMRVHHMPISEVGPWLACIYGGGGLVGALMGGVVCDRFVDRTGDRRWYAWLPAISTLMILPFSFFVYLWHNSIQALLVHTGTAILMHAWMGPLYGTVQSVAGAPRRAVAAAINLVGTTLIAYGAGPLVVGFVSDYFSARLGNESLRYSILALVVLTYSWAGVHFLLAARTLRADLTRAEATG